MSDNFEIQTGCEPVDQILKSVWSYAGASIEVAQKTQSIV